MNENSNIDKLKRIHGLPNIDRGMTSNRIILDNIRLSPEAKWHMSHKPYQCDYDYRLIKR